MNFSINQVHLKTTILIALIFFFCFKEIIYGAYIYLMKKTKNHTERKFTCKNVFQENHLNMKLTSGKYRPKPKQKWSHIGNPLFLSKFLIFLH